MNVGDYVAPRDPGRMSAREFASLAARAFRVSYEARGRGAVAVAALGFAFALLPSAVSVALRAFTDAVQGLAQGTVGLPAAASLLAALVALYLAQQAYAAARSYRTAADTELIARYISERVLLCTCTVRMRHIDGADDFAEKVSFCADKAGSQVAASMQEVTLWLQNLLSFAVLSAVLADVSPWIMPVVLATCLPGVAVAYRQEGELYQLNRRMSRATAFSQMYFQDCTRFQCLQERRFLRIFPHIKEQKWRPAVLEVIDAGDALTRRHTAVTCLMDLLRGSVYLAILAIVAHGIYKDPSMGLGAFTLAVSATSQLQNLATQLFAGIAQFAAQAGYMKDFFELEDMEREQPHPNVGEGNASETAEAGDAAHAPEAPEAADICFENVSFAYPESTRLALDDVSVTIREGERVAVVGRNGSGKSTFVNLLCGLYEPQRGSVRIGGREVRDDVGRARGLISGVFQDFGRYEDTIRFNVSVSDAGRTRSDEDMMDLLEKVGAADFVRNRTLGLDEAVGCYSEGGSNLSGGQWQRLAIARAAWRERARIMLLDEPTSALDPLAEAKIYRNFAQLVGDRTALFVSHRLGVASIVGRVLVFDGGRIVEDGSPEELLSAGGLYAELYESQAQWYR